MSRDDDLGENKFWLMFWGCVSVVFLTFSAMCFKSCSDARKLDLECVKAGGEVGKYINEPNCKFPEKK